MIKAVQHANAPSYVYDQREENRRGDRIKQKKQENWRTDKERERAREKGREIEFLRDRVNERR